MKPASTGIGRGALRSEEYREIANDGFRRSPVLLVRWKRMKRAKRSTGIARCATIGGRLATGIANDVLPVFWKPTNTTYRKREIRVDDVRPRELTSKTRLRRSPEAARGRRKTKLERLRRYRNGAVSSRVPRESGPASEVV